MSSAYTPTVRQLLDIAPVVFATPHFAIKGGSAISEKLMAMGYEVRQRRNSASHETRLMVVGPLAEVKVEVNEVLRGCLLPVQQRSLSPAAEEEFAQAVTLPLLATAELYGSKLVAAMDRQHPRDLFDVQVLYNDTGLTWAARRQA